MNWTTTALDRLESLEAWGYREGGPPFSEPAALAALAFAAHGRTAGLGRALDWLARVQGEGRAVGIGPGHPSPNWPTGLAVLAWEGGALVHGTERSYAKNIEAAVGWMLGTKGIMFPRSPELAHDTTLVGWSWVERTHSWVVPTAQFLAALKGAGCSNHPRSREAVRLLIDRLLPDGGCNYGNTAVLGRRLRPQVDTTGVALLALVGEDDPSGRVARSVEYLEGELSTRTPAASLGQGLIALAAHGRAPTSAAESLAAAFDRSTRSGTAPAELSLLCIAAAGARSPLVRLARQETVL